MNHLEVGKYWEGNADAWTQLARAGYDVYRDHMNTPAFFRMLPDVCGLDGLDVGCGEGYNTRLLAKRGARMTGIDVSARFIAHARDAECADPLGIEYHAASAVTLPFKPAVFDFAAAFMSMMDMPEHDAALAEIHRVLKPAGFFQFSICHPCSYTPHRRILRDDAGKPYAIEVGRYFEEHGARIEQWIFGAAPESARAGLKPFQVPCFHRTLSTWFNSIIASGFLLERIEEPFADDDSVRQCPDVEDTRIFPYFLHVRCRKSQFIE